MDEATKQVITEAVEKTVEAAEEITHRPGVKSLARLGFRAKGFLFIVIGSLALLLVFGIEGGRLADAAGALSLIAERPFGKIFLIVFVVGAFGHGLWNILRGAADVDDAGTNWQGIIRRAIAIGIGVFYLGLAVSAAEIVAAARTATVASRAEETLISLLLAIPLLGAAILFIIGLSVIGAGIHECYSGVSGKFRNSYKVWKIKGFELAAINVLGVLSFTARAVLLVTLGYFFLKAAFYERPGSVGLDAALVLLLRSSYGRPLVFMLAVGLICHGILAFYEAKYRQIC